MDDCLQPLHFISGYFQSFIVSFLGGFLYPWDLRFYNNVLNLLSNLYDAINMTQVILVFASIIIAVSAFSAFLIIKEPKRWIRLHSWVRVLFAGPGTAYLSIFFCRSIPEAESRIRRKNPLAH